MPDKAETQNANHASTRSARRTGTLNTGGVVTGAKDIIDDD